jgi:hypothetical protein
MTATTSSIISTGLGLLFTNPSLYDFYVDGAYRYKMDESTGTTAYDSSGNGKHGTLIGGVTHTTLADGNGSDYQNTVGYSEPPEFVTNGTFDTDTDWTKGVGWSISGGVAHLDWTQTNWSDLVQSVGVTDVTYTYTYTIKNYVSGNFRIVAG